MRRPGILTKPERVAQGRLTKGTLIEDVPSRQTRKPRPWHVIHACEYARDVANVVEAQISVGMAPYVITARTHAQKTAGDPASLMRAWQGIRTWRKQLDDCGSPAAWSPTSGRAMLHAHSFTAGMAAVRGNLPPVYDLRKFVEEEAAESGQAWLSRSFRTAEQFVLTRAAAVVVHGSSARTSCLERGVDPEDVFVVPDPVPVMPLPGEHSLESHWLHRVFGFSPNDAVAVVVKVEGVTLGNHSAQNAPSGRTARSDKTLIAPAKLVTLLQAFAQVHNEYERAKLFVIADSTASSIRNLGREFDLDHAIFVISSVDAERALSSADIVLDASTEASQHAMDNLALTALVHGRALLAPDLPANRDVTPDGRGCLWYKPADKKDLANRLAFLARNRDFRKALGDSGRKHILDTRAPERVGQRYAEVYRHAHQRSKKHRDSQDLAASLIPTRASL